MCRYENQILQEAIVRLNSIGIKVQVPMFDGCMAKITINHPINTIIVFFIKAGKKLKS